MHQSPLKIACFGMPGSDFSVVPFRGLLSWAAAANEDISVTHLVVPIRPQGLPDPRLVVSSPVDGLVDIACQAGVEVVSYPDRNDETLARVWSDDPPDLLIVACYPFMIPGKIIKMARLGGWNLHPSLLPAYRGPDPVFWQLHDGVSEFGVSLHLLSGELDRGDIISQQRHPVPAGVSAGIIQKQLARIGYQLIADALLSVINDNFKVQVQLPEKASYQPRPVPDSFILDASWSAERAYRFIKGVREYGQPFTLQTSYGDIQLQNVQSFEQENAANASHITNQELHIAMASGTLNVQLSDVLNMEDLLLT